MRPDEAQVFRRGNDAIVVSTRCKRCGGSRLWVDFQRELQCLDCDPPAKVYREKLEAQKLKKLAQAAQMQKLEDEDREAEEAAQPRKTIILLGDDHGKSDPIRVQGTTSAERGGQASSGEHEA